jgi:hypothetical protein
MKKPTLRNKESLRVPDLWCSEHKYIVEELKARLSKEEPKDDPGLMK